MVEKKNVWVCGNGERETRRERKRYFNGGGGVWVEGDGRLSASTCLLLCYLSPAIVWGELSGLPWQLCWNELAKDGLKWTLVLCCILITRLHLELPCSLAAAALARRLAFSSMLCVVFFFFLSLHLTHLFWSVSDASNLFQSCLLSLFFLLSLTH